jgi:hypothetical protein
MKTRLSPLVLLVAFLVGCSSLFTGTVTLTQIADDTQKQLATLWAQGKITPQMDTAIGKANADYRAAAATAQAALIAYKNGGSQINYVNALVAVRASLDSLVNLITPLIQPAQAATLKQKIATAKSL